jgi:hypothetical protein
MTHGKVKSFTERFGLSRRQTKRVPNILPAQEWIPFEKVPEHAMIFKCNACNTPRMYGRAFMIPENANPLLICHNNDCQPEINKSSVNKHIAHTFIGIYIGGAIRVPEMLTIQ